ncbi:uncharacterized protein C8R40DRAFT_1173044 [Lentinula edodes]|uniref:uncharacterized protein n=1 Tax=Lentinula edodes TaxID=5353 RepID=UPI001E8E57C5|nr:uncharacterized protein C8R40DRAFT_1173044 [Lentinula edodes]KAH7872976.1 hypothetical protein C8R40DRAFT_1173044 [Lentinula edodes]
MSGDLYDILHISREATPEDIRKAYKKQALQTHPDRLPPNFTPAEKAAAEDKFRKVNNAYEILKDPLKRQSYDRHGVWPPPPAETPPPASRYDPYSTRYQNRRNDYPRPNPPDPFTLFTNFHFTDPFELFDSFFRESLGAYPQDRRHSRDSRYPHRRHTNYEGDFNSFDGFGNGLSGARGMHFGGDDLMADLQDMHRNMLSASGFSRGMGMGMGFPPMISHFPTFPSLVMDTSSGSGSGRWAAESTMSQTINGVTQTVQKRRDWDGNVHITRTYPDGRKVVTINGVEQHDQGQRYIQSPPPPPPPTNGNGNNYTSSPPPPYAIAANDAMNYGNAVAPRPSSGRHVIPVVPTFRESNRAYENEGHIHPLTHSHPHSTKKRWWNHHSG